MLLKAMLGGSLYAANSCASSLKFDILQMIYWKATGRQSIDLLPMYTDRSVKKGQPRFTVFSFFVNKSDLCVLYHFIATYFSVSDTDSMT